MLGGGGGVCVPSKVAREGALGRGVAETSGPAPAGRERTGGGGGPDDFVNGAGDESGDDGVRGAE